MTQRSKLCVNAYLCGHITKQELYETVQDENHQDLEQVKREVGNYREADKRYMDWTGL